MASRLAHAAVFAVGAAVGAGITAALVRSGPRPLESPVQHSTSLQEGTKGVPTLVHGSVPPSEIIQFLGNPGTYATLLTGIY
jgi:hypothetical protein